MKNYKSFILLTILLCAFNSTSEILSKSDLDKNLEKRVVDTSSDLIVFEDGDKSIVKIVDTSGCKIKMIRKGIKGSIDKAIIYYIVFNGDTVDYKNFKCNKTAKKAVNIKDSDEMKLINRINSFKKLYVHETCEIMKGMTKINIVEKPLKGYFFGSEFENIKSAIHQKYNPLLKINKSSVKWTLNSSNLDSLNNNIVFVFPIVTTRINDEKEKHFGSSMGMNGLPTSSTHKNYYFQIIFEIQALLLDMKDEKVLYSKKITKKFTDRYYFNLSEDEKQANREKWFKQICDMIIDDFTQYCN